MREIPEEAADPAGSGPGRLTVISDTGLIARYPRTPGCYGAIAHLPPRNPTAAVVALPFPADLLLGITRHTKVAEAARRPPECRGSPPHVRFHVETFS